MTSVTWFICGVRCAGPTTCKITLAGTIASPVGLQVLARQPASWSLAQVRGGWQVAFEKGDHIIQVNAPEVGSDKFKGVTMALPGAAAISFNKARTELQAWITDSLTTQDDPKDPWPPPLSPQSFDDAAWFTLELTRLYKTIYVPKGVGPEPTPRRGAGVTARRGSDRRG